MAVYSMEGTQHNCYPGTTVLVNKLDLTTQTALSQAEQRIVTAMSSLLETTLAFENVDFAFYKRLHQQLFGDLYEWAGTVRTINLSKKGTRFYAADHLEQLGTLKLQRLAEMQYLCGMERAQFLDELTDFYHEMNMLHPFREGNGRTLRLFITLLVRNAGYDISFADCDADLLMIATIRAAQGDLSLLRAVFEELIG